MGLFIMMFLGINLVMWDFNRLLSLFMGVCLFSSIFVSKFHPGAMGLLVPIYLGCLASYGISRFNSSHRKWIIGALGGFVIMQAVWLILQYYNIDPFFYSLKDPSKDAMMGFCGQSGQLGTFFGITLPIMAYIHPGLVLVSLIGLAVAKSSFGFVSAVVSGLIYFFFTSKTFFVVFLAVCIIGSAVFFMKFETVKIADFGTRLAVWNHAKKVMAEGKIYPVKNGIKYELKTNPWWGYGLGNWKRIFPYLPEQVSWRGFHFNYRDEKFTHAHNDYIETYFDLGRIGLISLFLLISRFLFGFCVAIKDKELVLLFSCLVSYLLCATGNFISYIPISGMLLILCYGMYRGALKENG